MNGEMNLFGDNRSERHLLRPPITLIDGTVLRYSRWNDPLDDEDENQNSC